MVDHKTIFYAYCSCGQWANNSLDCDIVERAKLAMFLTKEWCSHTEQIFGEKHILSIVERINNRVNWRKRGKGKTRSESEEGN